MKRAEAAVAASHNAEVVVNHYYAGLKLCYAHDAIAHVFSEIFVEGADDVFHPSFAAVFTRHHFLERVRNFELKSVAEGRLQNYARLAVGVAYCRPQTAVFVFVKRDFVERRISLGHEKKRNHMNVGDFFGRHFFQVLRLTLHIFVKQHHEIQNFDFAVFGKKRSPE